MAPPNRDIFVNQQWQAATGLPFISRNPSTEETIWQGNAAAPDDVKIAILAARKASADWRVTPEKERIAYLEKFRDLLKENINSLAEVISKDTGKPLWESKEEVSSMINKVGISVQAYHERCSYVEKEHPLGRSITRHRPYGVLAVFGPFNFPGHLPHGHIIPALLAGNTVVFKPSEQTPLVGEALMLIWEQCGLPPGVINMIQGGRETGHLLATDPQVDGLLFTGSWETGLIFSELYAKHPEKILALELGGNNPLVVHEVKDQKAAALITIKSAFLTSGQRCSCARRLIVPKGKQGEEFISELVNMMRGIKVGPYTEDPEPFMGPVISGTAAKHLLAVQEAFKSKGGRPLVEMHLLKVDTALLLPGLMDVTHIIPKPDDEIFGPFLQLIRVPNFEAAIAEANSTTFGLTAGLLSDNMENYKIFCERIRAGVVNWNTPTTGASSAAPFGGIGRSGNHRPSGYYAADYCSYPVASIEAAEITMPSMPPGIIEQEKNPI